jgi:methyl-accepting chemotaxis protein
MNALYYRIGLNTKLIVLTMAAVLAMLVPVHQIWNDSTAGLASVRAEASGMAPFAAGSTAQVSLIQYRKLVRDFLTGKATRAELDSARSATTAALAEFARLSDVSHLDAMAPVITDLRRLFDGYADSVPQMNGRVVDALFAGVDLQSSFEAALAVLCNVSTISLDPEPDTYFLFDASVNHAILLGSSLARMRLVTGLIQATGADADLLGRLEMERHNALAQHRSEKAAVAAAMAAQTRPQDAKVLGDAERVLGEATERATAEVEKLVTTAHDHGPAGKNSTIAQTDTTYQAVDAAMTATKVLSDLSIQLIGTHLEERSADLERKRWWILGLVTALMVILIGMIVLVTLSISRPVQRLLDKAQRIGTGDLDADGFEPHGNNEMARLLQGLEQMRNALALQLGREREVARVNQRIRSALDNVAVSVMVTDSEHHIVHCNPALTRLFAEAEGELRTLVPGFSLQQLIGRPLEDFLRAAGQPAQLLAHLQGTQNVDIRLGRYSMRLVMSPIIDDAGLRLGSVVQWIDRTVELAAEEELAAVIAAAAQGDFSGRVAAENKQGFFRVAANNVNSLVQTASDGLGEIAAALAHLARGDLTYRIDRELTGVFGELKDSANATTDSLAGVVSEIRTATSSINLAAKEIAQGNQNLSSRTEEQAASLQETAASMEELTSTVKQNSDNALEADRLAEQAAGVARSGGVAVGEVVATMGDIHASARKIVDIISVIDGIAFQTNILALNAAVEAARAGEQGRGFAVVASEVRGLAQRSATAAKEIKTLIGESVQRAEIGSQQATRAGETIRALVESVQGVSGLVRGIANASTEQSAGIEQINVAVTHMDDGTQQNAALVEQAAAAAESLEEQAQRLVESVGAFRLAR